MNRAYVTDVHYRMGLAAVRSLGRRSIPVTAVEYDNIPPKSILGFYSRYTSDMKTIPGKPAGNREIADALAGLAAGYGRDPGIGSVRNATDTAFKNSAGILEYTDEKPVLIPVGLDTLMAVSEHSELLSGYYNFIVPSPECIEIANDTDKLLGVAYDAGIPIPDTTTLKTGETVEELSGRLQYPVVVKYRKGELLKLGAKKRYAIVHESGEFIKVFNEMHALQDHPIVQRYIKGSGYGVSAVFDKKGQPLEIFCHKRLREYPVSGGPSCFCESVWDDRLVDHAVRLLKALSWRGVAMVEFKGDPEGEICLMEINPRFWGSMPLSIISGCDIPYAVYRAALGECTDMAGSKGEGEATGYERHPDRYKTGVRMRYLLQDLMSVPGYLRIKSNKISFILQFLRQLLDPSIKDGLFEIKDWRPSLAYVKQALRKL